MAVMNYSAASKKIAEPGHIWSTLVHAKVTYQGHVLPIT